MRSATYPLFTGPGTIPHSSFKLAKIGSEFIYALITMEYSWVQSSAQSLTRYGMFFGELWTRDSGKVAVCLFA